MKHQPYMSALAAPQTLLKAGSTASHGLSLSCEYVICNTHHYACQGAQLTTRSINQGSSLASSSSIAGC